MTLNGNKEGTNRRWLHIAVFTSLLFLGAICGINYITFALDTAESYLRGQERSPMTEDGRSLASSFLGLTQVVILPGQTSKTVIHSPTNVIESHFGSYIHRIHESSIKETLQDRDPHAVRAVLIESELLDRKSWLIMPRLMLAGEAYYPVITKAGQTLIHHPDLDSMLTSLHGKLHPWVISSSETAAVALPGLGLAISPPLGSVISQSPQESGAPAEFKIRNSTANPIYVDPPSSSCTCTVATAWKSTTVLNPGESERFTVALKSNGASADRRDVFLGVRSTLDQQATQLVLGVYRWEPTTLKVLPSVLHLGRIDAEQELHREIRLEEVGTDRFNIVSVESPDCEFSHEISESTTQIGLHRYIVKVRFDVDSIQRQILNKGRKTFQGILMINTTSRFVPVVNVSFIAHGSDYP